MVIKLSGAVSPEERRGWDVGQVASQRGVVAAYHHTCLHIESKFLGVLNTAGPVTTLINAGKRSRDTSSE